MPMSVWLSARVSQKPHVLISSNFLHMLPVVVAQVSSRYNAICYVLPVLKMTSYNAGDRESKTSRRVFHPVRQMAAPVGRQTTLFRRDRQVAAPGFSLRLHILLRSAILGLKF